MQARPNLFKLLPLLSLLLFIATPTLLMAFGTANVKASPADGGSLREESLKEEADATGEDDAGDAETSGTETESDADATQAEPEAESTDSADESESADEDEDADSDVEDEDSDTDDDSDEE